MKKAIFGLMILLLISSVFAVELTEYYRDPSGENIKYAEDLPDFKYKYTVPEDIIGCKQTYGDNGESIICLKSNNCNPQSGYFVAKANLGYNEVEIDCWDANNNHATIKDNFTTSYNPPKKEFEFPKIPYWILKILSIIMMSIVLWQATKILKFDEFFYKYSIVMTLFLQLIELGIDKLKIHFTILIPISIIFIKYGYDEEWKKSIIVALIYVAILGLIRFILF